MSLSKDQLVTIKSLNLTGVIHEMDYQQFDNYCKALFAFIENFPNHEAKLKDLLKNEDYEAFSDALSSIKYLLEKIYAEGLAQSCNRLLGELKTHKYQIVEAHLTYFLAEISELSIDLQMARQKAIQESGTAPGESAENTRAFVEDNRPKSILAVDDVSLMLSSLKLALKNSKYKLTCVKSGLEALRFIQENTPDLFILDIEMPGMNGYELAEKIRKFGHKAPIVFLTGNAKEEYVIKAIKAGAADFIVKPINNEHVLEKINKIIG